MRLQLLLEEPTYGNILDTVLDINASNAQKNFYVNEYLDSTYHKADDGNNLSYFEIYKYNKYLISTLGKFYICSFQLFINFVSFLEIMVFMVSPEVLNSSFTEGNKTEEQVCSYIRLEYDIYKML